MNENSQNGWDEDANIESLTAEQVAKQSGECQQQEFANPPEISTRISRDKFARITKYEWAKYAINQLLAVCHNCGWSGRKYRVSQRTRCSSCHSPNITVVRSGMLSLLLRDNPALGVHIPSVKAYQKELQKQAKRRRKQAVQFDQDHVILTESSTSATI